MFSHELKQYFVDNKIDPTILEVQSRSSKKKVMLAYFKHPINGEEYKQIQPLIKGLFTSCALDLEHLLLMPITDLGVNINLMDAIDTASYHLEGKTPRRISFIESYDLSSMKPTPEEKPKPARKKAAVKRKPRVQKTESTSVSEPKKETAAKPKTARKAPAKKAPAKKAAVKKAPAKKRAVRRTTKK